MQCEWHGKLNKDSQELELTHLTHLEIGRLIGASRQWVSQTLVEFESEKVIRNCGKRKIALVNLGRLAEIANIKEQI